MRIPSDVKRILWATGERAKPVYDALLLARLVRSQGLAAGCARYRALSPGNLGVVVPKMPTDQQRPRRRAERLPPVCKCNARSRLLIVSSDRDVALRMVFVGSLADCEVRPLGEREPVWGADHWEPSPAVALGPTPAR